MPKADPIKDLAEKLLHTLEQQRQAGGDYPLSVERLASLADAQATPEQVAKALAKKPFAAKWIIVNKKDRIILIALLEDSERLGADPRLLEYALGLLCSADQPVHPTAKVIGKVEKTLRPAFKTALERGIAENTLPPTVGTTSVRGKPQLYLQQFPPPPPKKKPAEELSEKLVKVLSEHRQRGGEGYPLPLDRLFEQTEMPATPALRKQALGKEPFRTQTLLALPKQPDSLVVLADDRERLLASPLLLQSVLATTRTADNQAVAVADLVKKLPKNLHLDFRAVLNRQVTERVLPDGIGILFSKKKPLLFLLADLNAVPPPPTHPAAGEPAALTAEGKAPVDFAPLFEEAFARLDREHGAHNHVSLVELRRALPVERTDFDAGLQQLRRAGRYSLSAAEGRHGISGEEQHAGIAEDGSLLLFVSRRE